MENALTLTWMIIQVVLLDILLSGDNAIVIAMAAGQLPQRLRRTAIFIGTGGAVLIRFLMAAAIVWLLQIPYLHVVGGCSFCGLGVNLLIKKGGAVRSGGCRRPGGRSAPGRYDDYAGRCRDEPDNVIGVWVLRRAIR